AAAQLRSRTHPEVHGQRPHLTVTVSAAALRSGADAEAAVLQGVGPIHPASARRIACDAVKTEVSVAPSDVDSDAWLSKVTTPVVPLSVGRATRTIPVHIRTALCLRDKGCRFPGCDRPPAWTDGHHIIHWADGGPTELGNLVHCQYNPSWAAE
ncbi:MAG: HNH endonuclease signature motif containing protein, partial [Candidatus Dormiibacterota bacterium]